MYFGRDKRRERKREKNGKRQICGGWLVAPPGDDRRQLQLPLGRRTRLPWWFSIFFPPQSPSFSTKKNIENEIESSAGCFVFFFVANRQISAVFWSLPSLLVGRLFVTFDWVWVCVLDRLQANYPAPSRMTGRLPACVIDIGTGFVFLVYFIGFFFSSVCLLLVMQIDRTLILHCLFPDLPVFLVGIRSWAMRATRSRSTSYHQR